MCNLLSPGTRKHRCTPAAPTNGQPLFPLGSLYATPGALALLERHGVSPSTLLARHQCGDFGHVGADSVQENSEGIEHGLRVLSAYRLLDDQMLMAMTPQERRRSPQCWIITEADRSSTTILRPDEY